MPDAAGRTSRVIYHLHQLEARSVWVPRDGMDKAMGTTRVTALMIATEEADMSHQAHTEDRLQETTTAEMAEVTLRHLLEPDRPIDGRKKLHLDAKHLQSPMDTHCRLGRRMLCPVSSLPRRRTVEDLYSTHTFRPTKEVVAEEAKDTTIDLHQEIETEIAAEIGTERAHTTLHAHTATTMRLDNIAAQTQEGIETEIEAETAIGTEIETEIEEHTLGHETSNPGGRGVGVLCRRNGCRNESETFTDGRNGDRTR